MTILVLLAAPPQPEPIPFTGATVGVSAFSGPAYLSDGRVEGRLGFTAGFAGKITSPLFIADAELGYSISRIGAATASGVPASFVRQGLYVTFGLHPLFLVVLQNRIIHYILGAFRVDFGASIEMSTVTVGGDSRTRGDPAWHWGLGGEVPLGNPNRGSVFWLGWRFRQIRFSSDILRPLATELGDVQVVLTLAYRWNWK